MIRQSSVILNEAEIQAVVTVLRSGHLAQGRVVDAFESGFSNIAGTPHTVAVNSGTSALHLALLAAGIGAGDEVLVPSFTFAATANAVVMAGATPVFCDIRRLDYCIDVEDAAGRITAKTTAIIPVHLYGHPADMPAVLALAAKHGLLVIEDAAQAHMAAIDGRPVGSWGDMACFSFYPTKNMTTGEGGAVTTRSDEYARKIRLLRNQGMLQRYLNEVAGLNNRMTDIHAAIGIQQMQKLHAFTQARQSNAAVLSDGLRGVVVPTVATGFTHVYHQYTIRVPSGFRDTLKSQLLEHGIETGVFYPTPVHRLPAYNQRLALPETEEASASVLSLPVHPHLDQVSLRRIVDVVNHLVERLV